MEGVDWEWTDADEALLSVQNAELTARLHAAPTGWWPPYRDALREQLPLLNGEPDSSPLYMMAAFCDHKGRPSPYSEQEQAQLAKLTDFVVLLLDLSTIFIYFLIFFFKSSLLFLSCTC